MSLLLRNSKKSFSLCLSNHHLTLVELPFKPHAFQNPAEIIAVDHKLYLSILVLQTLWQLNCERIKALMDLSEYIIPCILSFT